MRRIRQTRLPVILIQNATILTVSHGTIEHGSILIKDGKIAEVGKSIKAPKDAQVIDAAGQYVIPGIIDCHSHIAIDGSVNEGSISVSSIANTADVLNPDDIDIYRDLAGGVTVANILHGSANPIGGQTVVIKLRWGQPASKLPFEGAVPGHQVRSRRKSQALQFQHPGHNPALSCDAHGSRRDDSNRVCRKRATTRNHGMTTTRALPPATKTRSRRAAIFASIRSSKCSKVSATSMRIATAKTKF